MSFWSDVVVHPAPCGFISLLGSQKNELDGKCVPSFLPIVRCVIYLQGQPDSSGDREDFVLIVLYKQPRTVFISSDWTFLGHFFLLTAVQHA